MISKTCWQEENERVVTEELLIQKLNGSNADNSIVKGCVFTSVQYPNFKL